ncbi:MAG: hypothetical protein MPW15_07220 [Candidatus Manganitrophus sp.]|nr:hypothetical protein [Candidatus Manganitrophus sp.]
MFQPYFIYALEGLAGFALVNILLLAIYTALNLSWAHEFKAITVEWINFVRRGIPVPADLPQFEKRLPGDEMVSPLRFVPQASTFETETYIESSFVRS